MNKNTSDIMFAFAKNYQAGGILLGNINHDIPKHDNQQLLAAPIITCLAFSLELMFKALIFATKNHFEKNMHKINVLYEKLHSKYQVRLYELFNQKYETQFTAVTFKHELKERAGNLFVSVRYIYESNEAGQKFDMPFVNQLIEVIEILYIEITGKAPVKMTI